MGTAALVCCAYVGVVSVSAGAFGGIGGIGVIVGPIARVGVHGGGW